jgi:hypothetical protein
MIHLMYGSIAPQPPASLTGARPNVTADGQSGPAVRSG